MVLVFVSLSEEDRFDSYSRMILKYFLAEGVVCRHELFVATAQDNPDEILQVGDETLCFSNEEVSDPAKFFYKTQEYLFFLV